jgi:hypothetical protein
VGLLQSERRDCSTGERGEFFFIAGGLYLYSVFALRKTGVEEIVYPIHQDFLMAGGLPGAHKSKQASKQARQAKY